ncbi:uncharacterized protein K460DRAFT_431794 [Cucurbitaria berberidis CBS 394.84]|uniref:DUF3533 domain-containing protein n=1 Tax=Cucurbitaria berberidis CBS 394.84 TaxID=1168544 RepID=A0A9P4GJG0_9PLEO|nr:uncharacterized protein K460DRAFT_431794 [Cucurbitaria berberidis CBS 394.84]KAF1846705.1 hypothetical protein K460DRAFT_431794 [Cucurbitaria berberidis CBS 394.84]
MPRLLKAQLLRHDHNWPGLQKNYYFFIEFYMDNKMGLFLIFWVITHVSTAFYDIEIAPKFYPWGYVWSLHSIVEGSRILIA